MVVEFTESAYSKAIWEKTPKNKLLEEAKDLKFHYGDASLFAAKYDSTGYLGRKVKCAIPYGLYELSQAIYDFALTLFSLVTLRSNTKANWYHCVRSLEASVGWFLTIFSDYLGSFLVQESLFQRKFYDLNDKFLTSEIQESIQEDIFNENYNKLSTVEKGEVDKHLSVQPSDKEINKEISKENPNKLLSVAQDANHLSINPDNKTKKLSFTEKNKRLTQMLNTQEEIYNREYGKLSLDVQKAVDLRIYMAKYDLNKVNDEIKDLTYIEKSYCLNYVLDNIIKQRQECQGPLNEMVKITSQFFDLLTTGVSIEKKTDILLHYINYIKSKKEKYKTLFLAGFILDKRTLNPTKNDIDGKKGIDGKLEDPVTVGKQIDELIKKFTKSKKKELYSPWFKVFSDAKEKIKIFHQKMRKETSLLSYDLKRITESCIKLYNSIEFKEYATSVKAITDYFFKDPSKVDTLFIHKVFHPIIFCQIIPTTSLCFNDILKLDKENQAFITMLENFKKFE